MKIYQQVKMIGQEAVGDSLYINGIEIMIETFQEEPVIFIVEEDFLAIITAIVNVVEVLRQELDIPACHRLASSP